MTTTISLPPSDAASLSVLLDRIQALVDALRRCDAAAKVRATLGTLRDARDAGAGAGVADALERMEAQVDAMIQKDTLHLLRDAVAAARRLSG